MDDKTTHTAIGLRLGTPICSPHTCQYCITPIDKSGLHGLSCRWSAVCHYRHSSLNNTIQRFLAAATIPSHLESSGISRSDGKRPDGTSLIPWQRGKPLIWDITCSDNYAPSYLTDVCKKARTVAALAEERKKVEYSHLEESHFLVPVAIETSGAIGLNSLNLLRDLARRTLKVSGEEKSFSY